jgi:predicted phage-related endonuclease
MSFIVISIDFSQIKGSSMQQARRKVEVDRRHFIGGSDARIIMGQDEKALIRLWQEKRGEVGPEDLSSAP